MYSAVTDNQGKVMYDYVMGLYDFLRDWETVILIY